MFKERRRPFLGLPLSFTTYELDETKLYVRKGIFTRVEEEIRLFRINDLTVRCTLLQRLFKVGDIEIYSTDSSMRNFTIKDIKNPIELKNELSDAVNRDRRVNSTVRELLTPIREGDDCDVEEQY